MTEQEGEHYLKDQLFHGLRSNICNAHWYMYDRPDSQYSKLVMAARKAETETPGSGASEGRAKSAAVELDMQPKATSSEPPYEAIAQQIAYLMSTITNQNASNNGQMVQDITMGIENVLIQKPKGQRKIKRYALLGYNIRKGK